MIIRDRFNFEKLLNAKERLYNRKYELMDKFEWTDENMQKIFALNDFIMQKERELYDNAVKMKNDLENHIKNGDTYYKTYDFEINLVYESDDEESSPFADNKTIMDLYYHSNFLFTEHFFANEGDDITPFEELFNRNENYNGYDCFRNCPDKFHYLCAYLHYLVDYNETYTLQDLLYMKPKNFSPDYTIHI